MPENSQILLLKPQIDSTNQRNNFQGNAEALLEEEEDEDDDGDEERSWKR